MDWCEEHDVQYDFGLPGNAVLDNPVFAKTAAVCVPRATGSPDWNRAISPAIASG